jgi:hypothetical protein
MASGYNSPSLTASGAIGPFRCVVVSGENTAAAASANALVVGVTAGGTSRFDDADTNIGDPVELQETGVKRIEAGAAISAGATVMAANGGTVITAATPGVGKYTVGVAITAAADAGDIILVAWNPCAYHAS